MTTPISVLAESFRRFAELESPGMSPFYSSIARRVAEDPEVLKVAQHTRTGQPVPNMLFGAVRFHLDHGGSPALLDMYPTAPGSVPANDPYPLFRDFVLSNRTGLIETLRSRSVQSNVVRRSAALLLGLTRVSAHLKQLPFASIEIGASLGLTLLWRRFRYEFGDGVNFGPPGSPVRIQVSYEGPTPVPPGTAMPETFDDVGIEISPVRWDDPESIAWLEALIWPEHEDNRSLHRASAPLLLENPPRIVEGDAVDRLPEVFNELPAGVTASVYHSHTLNQFAPEARTRLEALLCDESMRRPVFRLAFENERGHSALRLFEYSAGAHFRETHLADCEPHARWIRWRDRWPAGFAG